MYIKLYGPQSWVNTLKFNANRKSLFKTWQWSNSRTFGKRKIWAFCKDHILLSDSNGIRTHTYLVPKQTLNHLAKLAMTITYMIKTYNHILLLTKSP